MEKLKVYKIVRIIQELYAIEATSKEEAKKLCENPIAITVIKETITRHKRKRPLEVSVL